VSGTDDRYPCRCCGFYTLTDPTNGSYEICRVCFWEDDPVQNEDPSFEGGANNVSLLTARDNYVRFGVCEPQFSKDVRPPTLAEIPPPIIITGLEPLKQKAVVRGIKTLLLGIARGILSGNIGTFDGCEAIAAVSFPLDERELADILRTFDVVQRRELFVQNPHTDLNLCGSSPLCG
jgi:Cysteine-rich CPCC